MGGCRCVYRSCRSSTGTSPGLHYFHFPIRDKQRCDQWIENSRKPILRAMDRDRLRNKVICSLHFEDKCFTNEKHDRLIHSAVPTLGFENEDEITLANVSLSGVPITEDNDNIQLIPVDDDNTKFKLPDVGFSGMSYTICDDAIIPSSELPVIKLEKEVSMVQTEKITNNKPERINTNSRPTKQTSVMPPRKVPYTVKIKSRLSGTVPQKPKFKSVERAPPVHLDTRVVENENINNNVANITSYSLSTCNGDVSIEPVQPTTQTHIIPDIIDDNIDESMLCHYQNDNNQHSNIDESSPLLDNDVALQLNCNNDFTMSVTPVSLVQNKAVRIGRQEIVHVEDESSQESINNGKVKDVLVNKVTKKEVKEVRNQYHRPERRHDRHQERKNINTSVKRADKSNSQVVNQENHEKTEKAESEYMKMIKDNSRQIKQLKRLVEKQNKISRFMLQRKRLPRIKSKKLDKHELLEQLKNHVNPSLLAILKLEMLPVEEVVLSDNEERFITDLYTENPECYHLLRDKWNWNLPTERIEEATSEPDQ